MVALSWLASLVPFICNGQATLEYEVKAAFLLNFTKFVEWPPAIFADPGAPFAICVLGQDPFGRALDEVVAGETVAGHKLIVRRVPEASEPQGCQLVFVGEAGKDTAKTLSSLPHGVLTVGEGDRFLHDGGMIAFVIENRRVRFDIHQSAALGADLKLSSKLLSVARTVEK
jgi:hypothetical protein